MRKIGVFICHCGLNIAGTVDVERVAEEIRDYPGVVYSVDYTYMCSDPGQDLIKEAIAEHDLDGIIVAACSPTMHEVTFRKTAATAGLNPYLCEIANVREQCAWVHQSQPEDATDKAIEIIKTIVEKVRYDESLVPLTLPLVKRALVIGGGIAGLQAALDIAGAGYPVILVEKKSHLGGRMGQLSSTYLNFDTASDLLASMIEAVTRHPHIQVITEAEVEELGGYVGNFTVKVRRFVNSEFVDSEIVDSSECTNLRLPNVRVYDIGAIVVATGYDLYPKDRLGQYGGGKYPDVIDGLQFEQMLAAGGQIRRPSDGKVPKEVVWVQCAGSRDPELHKPYCSKVCCMYVAKQAVMYKRQVPEGQAYVFYIDIRSAGKGHEEFVQQAMEQYDVLYLRGKVSKVFQENGRAVVWGADTLTGKPLEVAADLVVLATATVPSEGAKDLGQRLRIATDEHGFFSEAHPKLRPVESLTAGIYLAGAAQFPKDIPETIVQASGAAAKVLSLFSQREMVQEPIIAYVDEELCSACGLCIEACPYEAREMHPWKNLAIVNVALCQGCGACVVACPNKASAVRNFTT
ncbi:MAG: CoB--CoM heterodisulfide reductase iron-sulfur subunit A family protein, partial [Anaerolineales bacterium]|nr:CoB--CoM heterodisulfide reductase iron-sulfur subunit A family protein [Anaerolineales bacterium]